MVFALQSCSLLSMMGDEEYEKVSDTLDLKLKNNRLTFPVKLNDIETSLLFDTGSAVPFLFDDKVLNNKIPEKISKFGSVNNFGNKLDFYRTPLSFENDLFKSDNTVFVVISDFNDLDKCLELQVTGGFYGKYFLDKILNLNFEQQKLFILDSLKKITYTEIESKFFDLAQVRIKLTINGKSEWFHFDTGNIMHPIILKSKSEIINDKVEDFIVKSNKFSLKEKENQTFYYEDFKIDFGDEQISSYVISNSGIKDYKYNNVGIQFIKRYNWILDYKNKKVYYKKYENSEFYVIKAPKNNLYYCTLEEGKLVVTGSLLEDGEPIYKLGNEIVSVDGTPITSQNVCFYLDLLLKTDWNTLNIETKP